MKINKYKIKVVALKGRTNLVIQENMEKCIDSELEIIQLPTVGEFEPLDMDTKLEVWIEKMPEEVEEESD